MHPPKLIRLRPLNFQESTARLCRLGRSGALAILLSTLLAGCSLVPTYTRPDPGLPEQWLRARDMSLEGAAPVRSGWWRSFNDPILTEIVERSLRDSFTLAAAQARIEEARGTAEMAGAPLYPALNLNGALSRSHQSGAAGTSGGQGSSHSQSLFAQAGYELDFWGKNRATAGSAQALTEATVFDGDTVALTLTASVTDTYFQVMSLQERLALAQKIAADAARLLTLVQTRAAAGVATDLQIEQQRNASATFSAAVPVLRQQLEQNEHLLAVLVGSTPERFTLHAPGLNGIQVPQAQPELPASVLQRRPDIRAAEARLISANYDVGAARAAFFPSISLTAQSGFSSGSLSHFFSANPLTGIAAALTQPIFQGGKLHGQLKFDRAHVDELVATYRKTVVGALQDVEDALSMAQHQQELESADRAAETSARRAAMLAEAQYRFGTADFLSVLDTQRTLYQAEDALLQVHLQRLQSAVALFRALGGGFGSPAVPPNAMNDSLVSDPISGERK